MSLHELQFRAEDADRVEDGTRRGRRCVDSHRQSGGGPIGGECGPRIPGRRYDEPRHTERTRSRNRRAHSTRLERPRGIEAFVLDPETPHTELLGELRRVVHRSEALA